MSEFCPQCGSKRTGAFKFCRSCGFDFDERAGVPANEATPAPKAPLPEPIAQPEAPTPTPASAWQQPSDESPTIRVPVGEAPGWQLPAASVGTPAVRARGHLRRNVLIGVGVLFGLGVIGSLAGGGSPGGSSAPSSSTVALATPSIAVTTPEASQPSVEPTVASMEPTLEPTPEITAAPPVAAPAFATIKLSGSRDKVAKIKIPENEIALVNFTYQGSSNFAVWTIEADGTRSELLVNTIGRYNGTTMFGVTEHPVALKIEGRGKWTATIKPILSAPRWDPSTRLAGSGDKVYLVVPPSSGFVTVSARYRGEDNFAVWAYNPDTVRELLINEIGNFQGDELLPDRTIILHVDADSGSWSFVPA